MGMAELILDVPHRLGRWRRKPLLLNKKYIYYYEIFFSLIKPLEQGCQTHFSSGATWRKIYSQVGRTGKIMA